ncbi:MAG: sulfurtransferase [Pseudomonadota bacterium]
MVDHVSPLVGADWLLANLKAPDLRVVDATWYLDGPNRAKTAKEEFDEAHIPDAVFFDIDIIKDGDTDLPHMLPSPVAFTSRVKKLGLGDGNRVVVYDRNRFMASARVWWMFRAMGVEDVYVLDGGLSAWTAAGGELTDDLTVPFERHFTPRVRADLIKDLGQMQRAINRGSHIVLDARPGGRFTGQAPEPREGLRSGHMPGARNVTAGDLVTEDGFLKAPDALARQVGSIEGPVITTCGSGVTASILALALGVLGRDDVAVYDGSWSEWGATEDCPVETGPGAAGPAIMGPTSTGHGGE